jgi:hypothetical protein
VDLATDLLLSLQNACSSLDLATGAIREPMVALSIRAGLNGCASPAAKHSASMAPGTAARPAAERGYAPHAGAPGA